MSTNTMTGEALSSAAMADMMAGGKKWFDTTEDWRDELLEAVPPIYPNTAMPVYDEEESWRAGFGYVFGCGEPYNHTKTGVPIYLWFRSRPTHQARMASRGGIQRELDAIKEAHANV